MSTNIDVVRRNLSIPIINWRVYYDTNGKIRACSPTRLDELAERFEHVLISADMGEKINTGVLKTENLIVINDNGSIQVQTKLEKQIAIKQDSIISKISSEIGEYLIGVTYLKDQHLIVFTLNTKLKIDLDELLENLPATNCIFITKRNDPAWLVETIDFPIADIIQNKVVVLQLKESFDFNNVDFLSSRLINELKIFAPNDIACDIVFFEFLRDLSGESNMSLVKSTKNPNSVINVRNEENSVVISLNDNYRQFIEVQELSALDKEIQMYICKKTTPFLPFKTLNFNFASLLSNDYVIDTTDELVYYCTLPNANNYIDIEKSPIEKVNNFYRDVGTVKNYIVTNTYKKTSLIWIKHINQNLRISINPHYRKYLKSAEIVGYVVEKDIVTPIAFNVDSLYEPLTIGGVSKDAKIFLNVSNVNNYFYIG